MKKLLIPAIAFYFLSCGNADSTNSTQNQNDTVGKTNPIAIDTMKHPSGVDNSSVISTDTAAMNVQNAYKKADSANKQ